MSHQSHTNGRDFPSSSGPNPAKPPSAPRAFYSQDRGSRGGRTSVTLSAKPTNPIPEAKSQPVVAAPRPPIREDETPNLVNATRRASPPPVASTSNLRRPNVGAKSGSTQQSRTGFSNLDELRFGKPSINYTKDHSRDANRAHPHTRPTQSSGHTTRQTTSIQPTRPKKRRDQARRPVGSFGTRHTSPVTQLEPSSSGTQGVSKRKYEDLNSMESDRVTKKPRLSVPSTPSLVKPDVSQQEIQPRSLTEIMVALFGRRPAPPPVPSEQVSSSQILNKPDAPTRQRLDDTSENQHNRVKPVDSSRMGQTAALLEQRREPATANYSSTSNLNATSVDDPTLKQKSTSQTHVHSSKEIPANITRKTPQTSPIIKRENSPPLPPSPIDVDAQPQTLYEQLGLPTRKSGSHRMPRPNINQDEKAEWSKKVAEDIRWARGKDTAPLVIGRVFWRSDGVCFDWSLPEEEIVENSPRVHPLTESRPTKSTSILTTATSSPSQPHPFTLESRTSGTTALPTITTSNHETRSINLSPNPSASTVHVKREVDELNLGSLCAPPSETKGPRSQGVDNQATENHALSFGLGQSAPSSTDTIPSLLSSPSTFTSRSLNSIATSFLDRYTRCFDDMDTRPKLREAYTPDAFMSLQFNDLPSEGICPRVGMPKKQSHYIVNLAERDEGRNLLLGLANSQQPKLVVGPAQILKQISKLESLMHVPTPMSSREYHFDVSPLGELHCLLLDYCGEFYSIKGANGEPYVCLRFQRSFILTPNTSDAISRIDWPWLISNDQLTLFHRPGIVCQCPP